MITGILLVAIISFIAVISYKRPRLEHRIIKNIPLIDWMNILIIPLFIYIGLTLMARHILSRDRTIILDFDDFTLVSFGIFFLAYAFVGNSIHFVSKVLSRYIPPQKQSLVYRINEIFHGKLSHYLIFLSSFMVVFILALLEINYPLPFSMHGGTEGVVFLSGLLLGISATKAVFYTSSWFGGYNKPLFFLVGFLLFILVGLFRIFDLHLLFYPIAFFVVTMFSGFIGTFVMRQVLIFLRLGKKRRLQFLAKILSV